MGFHFDHETRKRLSRTGLEAKFHAKTAASGCWPWSVATGLPQAVRDETNDFHENVIKTLERWRGCRARSGLAPIRRGLRRDAT